MARSELQQLRPGRAPMRQAIVSALGRSRRAQAAQVPIATGGEPGGLAQAAHRLLRAASHERQQGCPNGRDEQQHFSELLTQELAALERASPLQLRPDVQGLRLACPSYPALPAAQRLQYLEQLQATVQAVWQPGQQEAARPHTPGRAQAHPPAPPPPVFRRVPSAAHARQASGAAPPKPPSRAALANEELLQHMNQARKAGAPKPARGSPPPPPAARPRADAGGVAAAPSGAASLDWSGLAPGQAEDRGANGARAPPPADGGREDALADAQPSRAGPRPAFQDDGPDPGGLGVRLHPSCASARWKVIVFDTETTGRSKAARVVELAAYALESGEQFATLLNPRPTRMHPGATAVNNITDTMVRAPGVPTFKSAGPQFLEFVARQAAGGAGAVPLLVAHNFCAFDFRRLDYELGCAGLAWPPGCAFLDSLPLARQVLPDMQRYKQGALADALGVAATGPAHRALSDVQVLAQLVQRVVAAAPGGHIDAVMASADFQLQPGRTSAACGLVADLKAAIPECSEEGQRRRKAKQRPDVARAVAYMPVAQEDPLTQVERAQRRRGLRAADLPPSGPRAGDALPGLPASWPEVLRRPAGERPLIDLPLASSKAPFTPTQRKKLAGAELGPGRVLDVLQHWPRAHIPHAAGLREEAHVTLTGTVVSVPASTRFSRYTSRADVTIELDPPEGAPDGAGERERVLYQRVVKGPRAVHGVRGLLARLPLGTRVVAQGRVSRDGPKGAWKLEQSASIEPFDPEQPPPTIHPVYAQKLAMAPRDWQDAIGRALARAREHPAAEQEGWDCIPSHVRKQEELMDWFEAVEQMHCPSSEPELEEARRRLAFEENLLQQLPQLLLRELSRRPTRGGSGLALSDTRLLEAARGCLPYSLTGGQERALRQILGDMGGPAPMLRLLQGEVGCGKTIVAFLALLAAAGSGYQGALMAPTEVLTEQHFRSLSALASRLPPELRPRVGVLTRSTRQAQRRELLAELADGRLQILLGTHSLLSESVAFARLGLAIIDEQHKFGVEQRAALQAKSPVAPHMLAMSATPIPRTLALVAHGDMAFTAIDEMPPGRARVATAVVQDAPEELKQVYAEVAAEVAGGGRAFIVFPLIEESAAERLDHVRAAEVEHARLQAGGALGPGVAAGLLHGRMGGEEKAAAVARFVSGETPVLVSTTLVEVGIDVPEASVMVVHHAERYGLAKLHQLRGRVGRGARPARCFLVASSGVDVAHLRVLEEEHSGLQIAEVDLAHRGPGEVLGRQQSGRDMLASLRLTQLPQDRGLMEAARRTAAELLALYGMDPADWPPALLLALARPDLPKLDQLPLGEAPAQAEAAGQ